VGWAGVSFVRRRLAALSRAWAASLPHYLKENVPLPRGRRAGVGGRAANGVGRVGRGKMTRQFEPRSSAAGGDRQRLW